MKVKIAIFMLSCLLCAAGSAAAGELTDYIPESCICSVAVYNMTGDAGLSWLVDAWINSPRESGLREIARAVGFKDIGVAVFKPQAGYNVYPLVVLKTQKNAVVDKAKLDAVINPDGSGKVIKLSHKNKEIFYTEIQKTDDFSAYCTLDDAVLFGADNEVIKKVLDQSAVSKSAAYKSVKATLPTVKDGFFFTDNSDTRFADFLTPLEKEWKLTLLLSVDSLEWIAASFDIIDDNKAAGVIIFQGKDDIEDIKDDAEFIGEAFKRKFMADKISYTSDVTVKDKTVTLTIEVEGLKPLWTTLFANGVFSIIARN